MDERLAGQLERLAWAAHAFYVAHEARNKDYDWLTVSEREALANLRATLNDLAREEAKPRRGVAA